MLSIVFQTKGSKFREPHAVYNKYIVNFFWNLNFFVYKIDKVKKGIQYIHWEHAYKKHLRTSQVFSDTKFFLWKTEGFFYFIYNSF